MPSLSLMTDDEIIRSIAKMYEQHRLEQALSEQDVSTKGGVTKDAIHRFKNGKNINLKNFIGILRGVGRVDALSLLFPDEDDFSPLPHKQKPLKKRVHKKTKKDADTFVWGEDA
ncbi:hypothetical protein C9926_02205 [Sulfurovum lithotrophicum]|nr:hypothetical protein C9926_02205 [Sulfurovum lithotrophicum]